MCKSVSDNELIQHDVILHPVLTWTTQFGKVISLLCDCIHAVVEAVWVKASYGNAPPGTLVGGHDSTGEPIYVARAEYRDELIPGKLITSQGCTIFTWNGEENKRYEYQVLVGSTNIWVPASGTKIPNRTFAGGYTKSKEPLYIGRVRHQDSITIGKVQQSKGLCYIAFNGKEISFSEYEVLTY